MSKVNEPADKSVDQMLDELEEKIIGTSWNDYNESNGGGVVRNLQIPTDDLVYHEPYDLRTLKIPKTYEIDTNKIKTLEDVIAVMSGVKFYVNDADPVVLESVRHLLKDEK